MGRPTLRSPDATAIRAAIAEADRPSATPTPTDRIAHTGDDRHEPFGEWKVAPEVARRPAGGDAQPSRFDDLEPGGNVGDRPHDRLELARVAVGIALDHLQLGTRRLRHAAPVAVAHADGACGRRAGDHAVGVEHGGRLRVVRQRAATVGHSGHHTVTSRGTISGALSFTPLSQFELVVRSESSSCRARDRRDADGRWGRAATARARPGAARAGRRPGA